MVLVNLFFCCVAVMCIVLVEEPWLILLNALSLVLNSYPVITKLLS